MSMIATFLPAPLVSGALRSSTAAFRMLSQHRLNTVTTNVPGPRHTLYALGRPLLEYIPFVPITHGMRVGVAMLSYDGRVGFGVTGDWATVPDLRPMIQGIDAEMAALLAAAARKTGKTGKSGRTGRARARR
jgi:diacylglycerol O-acyltransferase